MWVTAVTCMRFPPSDYAGDVIQGSFYGNELQKVSKKDGDLWKVEKILKKRTIHGRREVIVKWIGYPKKFNSWIPEANVQDI